MWAGLTCDCRRIWQSDCGNADKGKNNNIDAVPENHCIKASCMRVFLFRRCCYAEVGPCLPTQFGILSKLPGMPALTVKHLWIVVNTDISS